MTAQAALTMVGKVTWLWAVIEISRLNWPEEVVCGVNSAGSGGKSDGVNPANFDLQKSCDASWSNASR